MSIAGTNKGENMSIASYNFSQRGIMHIESDLPCQDSSDIMNYGLWKVAVVADGVGSCKNSDDASRIAVKSALKTVYNCFPNNCKEEDLLSLIKMAFHCAANNVEMYVEKVNGELKEYHTTLAMALYDGKNLYYGNAGDSGIIALDDYGDYHVVTSQQNNEYGEVITLASRNFVVGKADYNAVAVLCMTDGVLEWVAPGLKGDNTQRNVYVPRANLFVQPELWAHKEKMSENTDESLKKYVTNKFDGLIDVVAKNENNQELLDIYGNLDDGNLRDDISVSAIINYDADILPEEIKWTPPPKPTAEEMYCQKWKEILKIYPSVAKKEFASYISRNNPSWTDEEVNDYARHIWSITTGAKNKTKTDKSTDNKKADTSKDNINKVCESNKKESSTDNKVKAECIIEGKHEVQMPDNISVETKSESLSKNKEKKKTSKLLKAAKEGLRILLEIDDLDNSEETKDNSENETEED